ncbi:helix-hairpin-helix domain-containing protein [Cellulomonas timonensis]|uniref:helix-hairpin-helix domain-containing protein n=1 Tax=Cellulomonas timonensis TaxID=1689271 RepID=UPI000B034E48|nr:helix-hairpin-helix domain-containing protein [Cellulomonas timonensis]
MTASPDGIARDRLLGLAAPPGHPAARPRWTPERSHQGERAVAEPEPRRDGVADDAADVADRWRQGALARVGGLYAAEHGDPLEHGPATQARERGRPRQRWAVPMRLALTASVVVALVGGGVAVRALSAPRGPEVAESLPEVAGPSAPVEELPVEEPAPVDSTAAMVVVHVVGEVALPGLVSLPAGSRVADAVTAVGGATGAADLAAVNLARQLVDGEQVLVPAPGQAAPEAGSGRAADSAAQGSVGQGSVGQGSVPSLVNLNVADLAALDGLPGIGPVLAERIVAWREEHGRFSDVEELGEVSGIGPALLGKVRPLVRV